MKTGINLITQEGKERARLSRINSKIKTITYLISGIFLVVVSLILVFFLISKKNLNDNNNKIQAIKLNIEKFNKEESELITIINRASVVNEIYKQRKNYSEVLTTVSSLLVPEFKLSLLEVKSPNELKLSGICKNLASLTNFNERLEEIKSRKIFSTVIYPKINRDLSGEFSISLEMKK